MTLLLAADIGGTKSVLAIFDLDNDLPPAPIALEVYASSDFDGVVGLVETFLAETGNQPEYACLAMAGVVSKGQARLTNLPWMISESVLAKHFGLAAVWLINDLTAVCCSLPLLQKDDWLELQAGQEVQGGVRAVIAPGTGLGEGFMLEMGGVTWAQGTEGGHCDFAPTNAEQAALLAWMRGYYPEEPISYEMLCSGLGLPALYAFFKASGLAERPTLNAALTDAIDQTPLIINGALNEEQPCPLCRKSVDTFLAILGAEAGNLALKLYSTGGLYIGGGIMPRLVGRTSFAPMLAAFNNKEKMAALMATMPLRLIIRKDTALLGAAGYGAKMVLLLQGEQEPII